MIGVEKPGPTIGSPPRMPGAVEKDVFVGIVSG